MKLEDMTKEELIEYINNLNENENWKYWLIWDKEKHPEKIVIDCDKNIPVLAEITDRALSNWWMDNYLIEWDNFHSLTVLNYTHREKIDIIYIDPPYNTGNEDFMYNDKFINVDDGYRHSKWLNFMEKRLKLAKNLLKNDWIIIVSINETEQAQLKLLLDKIFWNNNFLSNHHIQTRYSTKDVANNGAEWLPIMESVYIYAKNVYLFKPNLPKDQYDLSPYHYKIEELERWKIIEIAGKKVEIFNKKQYKIIDNKTNSVNNLKEVRWSWSLLKQKNTAAWYYNEYLLNRLQEDGVDTLYKIYGIGEDWLWYRYVKWPQKLDKTRWKIYQWVPNEKKELILNGTWAFKEKPIVNYKDFSPDFGNIVNEGWVAFNNGKKPIKMLKEFINYHTNKDAIVLDFFAGSGSTGHAVLDLNSEDGWHRKFILCTNNENNICEEITYKRLQNVIKGYGNNKGLEWSLKYFKTEFVANEWTKDQLYFDLTEKCIPMLHMKEDTFIEVETNDEYSIYTNKDKSRYTCVYFDIIWEKYEEFKNKLRNIKEEKALYIFTLWEWIDESDLKWINNYKVEAIPQKIYELYKKVVKISKNS